ncbi:hypothetical protein IW150_005285 [Coemansia sp. RSA 2607]|nr:hypothetical protein IW150_005285 [Coemansia sp. RSA 2607]
MVQSSSPETTAAAVAATLAAEIAAATTPTIDTSLLAPFPTLPDEPTLLSPATAAAISSAMASAQLTEPTLSSEAHDPVLEIMHSYQQTNAHRRRSSVEAAAAASSVLASIASTGKTFDHAAPLLGMHGVVLPTIPSESASLRNTPGPSESFDPAQLGALQGLSQQDHKPPALNIAKSKRASLDDESLSDDQLANGMPLTPDAPGSGRPGSLRHLTADERRARRLQRNRLAAKECRQKKKAYIGNLEAQVCDLQEENAMLRKELEELNAKLTLSAMRASASSPTLDCRLAEVAADDPSTAAKRARVSGD